MRPYVLIAFITSLLFLIVPTCEKPVETPSELVLSASNAYYLDTRIDYNSYMSARNGLLSLRKDRPRYLIITTPGGQVFYGKLLKEFIKENKINTICFRFCGSMGTVVFNAGSQRLITENTKLFFHEWFFTQISGNITSVRKQVDDFDVSFMKENSEIARRSGMNPYRFVRTVRKDTTFTTSEILEAGLADGQVKMFLDPANPPRKATDSPDPEIIEISIIPQVLER